MDLLTLVDSLQDRGSREIEEVDIVVHGRAHEVALESTTVHYTPIKDICFSTLNRTFVQGTVWDRPTNVLRVRKIAISMWLASSFSMSIQSD